MACVLIVIPRSRSSSIASRCCSCKSRSETTPVRAEAVGKCRLAVVDVRDDAEVADMGLRGWHGSEASQPRLWHPLLNGRNCAW